MFPDLSARILALFGWRIKLSERPFPEKYIVIVIPHTSNWDFPLGVLVRSAIREDIKFVAKDSLFRWPVAGIFRALGGVPVDRSKRSKFVEGVVEIFQQRETFKLCIAPEGTRSRVEQLKTGFYYISLGANVPLVLCRFDWATKVVEFGEPWMPSGDKEADFAHIYDYFRGTIGKIPENSFLYNETVDGKRPTVDG